MLNKIIIITICLFLQACGGGSSSGGGDTTRPPVEIQFEDLTNKVSVRWDQIKRRCNCRGEAKFLTLGAITREIMEEEGYQLQDLLSQRNLESFRKFIKNLGEKL